MRVGFVSLTKGVKDTKFKSCTLKYATEDNLKKLIKHNLDVLDKIIDYNIDNDIKVFRISSDIIPFGSSLINTVDWPNLFKEELNSIGEKIAKAKIRVSMHPGQYTVINSLKEDVIENAIKDLEYHDNFLTALKTDKTSKLVLHIGGIYGDKQEAKERFIYNYKLLSKSIKDRLIIENDDKSHNIEDVLEIAHKANIPVVYDNLHNAILPADKSKDDNYWIKQASKTWKKTDGRQKIHYSQQDENKRTGSHSQTINLKTFLEFAKSIELDIDVMLEVKDKNISAIKCKNALNRKDIKYLEKDWAKYKYTVLEKNPNNYQKIRELLKDKNAYPVLEFYKLVEESLEMPENKGYCINAFDHIWGYFKKEASDKEKEKYLNKIEDYKNDKTRRELVVKLLKRMADKYNQQYLLNSYYFDI